MIYTHGGSDQQIIIIIKYHTDTHARGAHLNRNAYEHFFNDIYSSCCGSVCSPYTLGVITLLAIIHGYRKDAVLMIVCGHRTSNTR